MKSQKLTERRNGGSAAGAGDSIAGTGPETGQDQRQDLGRRLPDWPRGMREPLAAEYVGLSFSTFRREWTESRAPGPVLLTRGRQVWLREDLDRWLDRKAGRLDDSSPPQPARGEDALASEWDAACGDIGGPPVS